MNGDVSRIPNISCMKSCIEGRGRAVLGNTADSACNGLNWLCCLARPSHALQSRISCKIYLESLKHTRSPCAGPIDHSCNFIYKILSVLWLWYHNDRSLKTGSKWHYFKQIWKKLWHVAFLVTLYIRQNWSRSSSSMNIEIRNDFLERLHWLAWPCVRSKM